MDSFGNLMDNASRERLQDFADRYDRGAPYDDISEEEAINRYREVIPELSGEDYLYSAREAFSRMEPEERVEFGRELRDQSLQQGSDFPDSGADDQEDRFQDPDYLAQVTERIRREQPDLLEGLVGDGSAGLVGGMMGEGMTGGEGVASNGGMLGNPVAKAALAGIAAMGVKKMMAGRSARTFRVAWDATGGW